MQPEPAGTGVTPEQLQRYRRLTQPPDNELPAAVPVNAVLARTPDLAVALLSVNVHSTGVLLSLTFRNRGGTGSAPQGGWPSSGASGAWMSAHRPDSPDRWLLGVQYPDGRTASTLSRSRRPGTVGQSLDEGQPRLLGHGGGGGGRTYNSALWLAPLPGPGPLTVVFAWPAMDIEELSIDLDTEPWRHAAMLVTPLWDHEPDPPPQTPPPPLPPIRLQPGGWFERNQPA